MSTLIGKIAKVDICIKQGDDFVLPLQFTDDSGAINLTGSTVILTVKTLKTDADPGLYQQKVSVHSNPTGGITSVSIPKATTRTFAVDTPLFYDIQLTDSTGIVSTLFEGLCELTKDITIATS